MLLTGTDVRGCWKKLSRQERRTVRLLPRVCSAFFKECDCTVLAAYISTRSLNVQRSYKVPSPAINCRQCMQDYLGALPQMRLPARHSRKSRATYRALFKYITDSTGIRDGSVGTATGYEVDDREVEVRVPVGVRIFCSPRRPDRLWGPPSLLYNRSWGLFPRG
jgi:hypothetical protein